MAEHPSFTLAGLLAAGGTAGYIRTRSTPSLVAGVGLGVSYAYAGYLLKNNKDYGSELALANSVLLTGSAVPRIIKTGGRAPVPLLLGAAGGLATYYYQKKFQSSDTLRKLRNEQGPVRYGYRILILWVELDLTMLLIIPGAPVPKTHPNPDKKLVLGYSRDPFAALPKQLLSHENFLLDHYIRVVVPHNVKTCRLFNKMNDHEGRVMRDWVGLAITDSDLLCSIILLGACRHILTNNPNSGFMPAALQYKYNGLKALRHAVSGASPTVSALTIAKACAMALDEYIAMSSPPTAIPTGSWVLVTGATGFVASHVTRQLLQRGFKVRGTVRDQAKAQWLIDDHFKSYAESGSYELVTVPDLSATGAFDEAVKGVSAVAHIASVLDFDPNPNNVVPQTVAGVTSVLESASKESSVTRFVFTSSIVAAVFPTADQDGVVDRNSWNEFAVKEAWAPPPYEPSRAMLVYAASKVAAEQVLWKYVDENKPHFVTNVVSPSGILGEPLHERHASSYGNWIYSLFTEKREMIDTFQTAFFVDVQDVALVHVAALLDPEVKDARLQTWGHKAHWNDFLPILRELRPQRKFIDDYPETFYLKLSTDQSQSVALLKKWAGQDGWKPLKQIITEAINNPYWKTE
ncbi:aldehyde reductase 2 [Fusarium phyllophilum]|uniref:Aldehyde reductase 2 n=1 Tax=Fusarium phyllophilum TaxID=47803 RepID=A0A8H5JM64_9HYPO|nr:aldehyde reductase 2 [Fusarium phyllophilum]